MPTTTLQFSGSLQAALLIGVGLMAAVDEIVFHQVLAWHHFYDQSTPAISLLSDGLLHAGELIALVAGFFLLSDLRHRHALATRWAWAGVFLGAGGFSTLRRSDQPQGAALAPGALRSGSAPL